MPIFYFRWYGLRQKDGWIIVIITKITIIIITYAFLSCREIVTSEIVHVILSLFSDWSSMWTFRTACLWLLIFVVGSSDSCSMCLFIKMPHLGSLQCCAYHLVLMCCFLVGYIALPRLYFCCIIMMWFCVSVYQVPYIIAIMQQGVEIRTMEPRLLIQSMELPKLKLICIGRYRVWSFCVLDKS